MYFIINYLNNSKKNQSDIIVIVVGCYKIYYFKVTQLYIPDLLKSYLVHLRPPPPTKPFTVSTGL